MSVSFGSQSASKSMKCPKSAQFATGYRTPSKELHASFYLDKTRNIFYNKINGAWKPAYRFAISGKTLSGYGSPPATLGNNGDVYINSNNGDQFTKANGVWIFSGAQNNNQSDPQIIVGNEPPTQQIGETGDIYNDVTNGVIYNNTVNGWESVAATSQKGEPGSIGMQGMAGPAGQKGDHGPNFIQDISGMSPNNIIVSDGFGTPQSVPSLVSSNLADNSVTNAKIIAGGVTPEKIAYGSNRQVLATLSNQTTWSFAPVIFSNYVLDTHALVAGAAIPVATVTDRIGLTNTSGVISGFPAGAYKIQFKVSVSQTAGSSVEFGIIVGGVPVDTGIISSSSSANSGTIYLTYIGLNPSTVSCVPQTMSGSNTGSAYKLDIISLGA